MPPATRRSDPGQEGPLVRGFWGAAGGPDTSARDATTAPRSAIGGPQRARTRGHSGEGSLLRLVECHWGSED
eukprot:8612859-Pyramimonas_sp.AAC.1